MKPGLLLLAALATQPPPGWQDAAVGMLMSSSSSSSSGPVATQTLAPQEVLLELAAHGIGYTPADTATLRLHVQGSGADEATARAEHDAALQRIRDTARSAGVAAGDIKTTGDRFMDLEVFEVQEPPPPAEAPSPSAAAPSQGAAASPPPLVRVQLEPPRPRPSVRTTLTITVRDVSRLASLVPALGHAGGEMSGQPQYSVTDDSAARRAARASALAKARADADAYATALNMRVVRMARVTERGGFDFMGQMFTEMMGPNRSRMGGMMEPSEGQVPTLVFVGVDFILAPQ